VLQDGPHGSYRQQTLSFLQGVYTNTKTHLCFVGQANLTGNMRPSCVSEHLQKSTQHLTCWVQGDIPQ